MSQISVPCGNCDSVLWLWVVLRLRPSWQRQTVVGHHNGTRLRSASRSVYGRRDEEKVTFLKGFLARNNKCRLKFSNSNNHLHFIRFFTSTGTHWNLMEVWWLLLPGLRARIRGNIEEGLQVQEVDVSELDEVAGEGPEMDVTLASSAENHESNARILESTATRPESQAGTQFMQQPELEFGRPRRGSPSSWVQLDNNTDTLVQLHSKEFDVWRTPNLYDFIPGFQAVPSSILVSWRFLSRGKRRVRLMSEEVKLCQWLTEQTHWMIILWYLSPADVTKTASPITKWPEG